MQWSHLLIQPQVEILPLHFLKNPPSLLPAPSQPTSRNSRLASGIACIALLGITALSAYMFFVASHPHPRPQRLWRLAQPVAQAFVAPSFEFAPEQELAAVTAFVTAYASNALPPVDVSLPIDPHLVLGFDVVQKPEELLKLEEEVWTRYPVVLYCKHYSAVCRSVKAKLNLLKLKPSPVFVDVDLRDDKVTLSGILSRITGMDYLPILLIGGEALQTKTPEHLLDILDSLEKSGDLETIMGDAGVTTGRARKVVLRKRRQADPKKRRQALDEV